jgi:hypothetical protein
MAPAFSQGLTRFLGFAWPLVLPPNAKTSDVAMSISVSEYEIRAEVRLIRVSDRPPTLYSKIKGNDDNAGRSDRDKRWAERKPVA